MIHLHDYTYKDARCPMSLSVLYKLYLRVHISPLVVSDLYNQYLRVHVAPGVVSVLLL